MDVTLVEYMNAAIERQRLRSDRGLARAIDVEQAIVSRWRTGKALPTEPQMVKLAQLAERDEDRATLLLGLWRATEEPVRDTYRRLLQRLGTGPGLAVAVAAALALAPPLAAAEGNSLVSLMIGAANVYYGKFRRFSRRVAAGASFLGAQRGPPDRFGRRAPLGHPYSVDRVLALFPSISNDRRLVDCAPSQKAKNMKRILAAIAALTLSAHTAQADNVLTSFSAAPPDTNCDAWTNSIGLTSFNPLRVRNCYVPYTRGSFNPAPYPYAVPPITFTLAAPATIVATYDQVGFVNTAAGATPMYGIGIGIDSTMETCGVAPGLPQDTPGAIGHDLHAVCVVTLPAGPHSVYALEAARTGGFSYHGAVNQLLMVRY
jgi:hypothetical protein